MDFKSNKTMSLQEKLCLMHLELALRKNKIPWYKYGLGEKKEKRLCLYPTPKKWIVSYIEENKAIEPHEFKRDDLVDACEEFIRMLPKVELIRRRVWTEWAKNLRIEKEIDSVF